MVGKKKPLRSGSICEIKDGDEYFYVQYVGQTPNGTVVIVFPFVSQERIRDLREIIQQHSPYHIGYPLKMAVRQGLASVEGEAPLALETPQEWRRPVYSAGSKMHDKWLIDRADGSVHVLPAPLERREAKIAIAVSCSHDLLIQQIRDSWRPEVDFV